MYIVLLMRAEILIRLKPKTASHCGRG